MGAAPAGTSLFFVRKFSPAPFPAWPLVGKPVPRTRTVARRPVVGVQDGAALKRETPAPDTSRKPELQTLQLFYPPVCPRRTRTRQPVPVPAFRYAIRGQLIELLPHLPKRETDPLSEHDKRHPPHRRTRVTPMSRLVSLRMQKPVYS